MLIVYRQDAPSVGLVALSEAVTRVDVGECAYRPIWRTAATFASASAVRVVSVCRYAFVDILQYKQSVSRVFIELILFG